MKNHLTIKENGQHEIEIKKSRFIAHLKRVESADEAQNFIDQIKKEHWKATHNCSAYVIGENDDIQKAHDDGEPSGTAGLPILEYLKKRKLKNVACVVTRYFGGTKLGASGLIRAYGGVVSQAVDLIGVVEKQLLQQFFLSVNYPVSGKIENELQNSNYILQNIDYTEKVTFLIYVQVNETDQFYENTSQWLSGQGELKKGRKAWLEVDVSK